MSNRDKIAVIVLAAGLGTRMKSNKAKVLHEILGKPMIFYVMDTARKIAGDNVIVVVGNQAEKVKTIVSKNWEALFAVQEKQLGTGHAAQCAFPYLPDSIEQVIILYGDVPLLTCDTVNQLLEDHLNAKRHISILAVEVENPKGYGRVLFDQKRHVYGIIEESDATETQKRIKIVNTGIYCVEKNFLLNSVSKIEPNNAQGEFYLTDIIKIGYEEGKIIGALIGKDSEEFIGVNNPDELTLAGEIMQSRSGNIT